MPSQRTYGTQASQGPSRRRQEPEPESSEEDEAEVEEGQADAEGLTQATGNGGLSEAIKKLAGQLCRFALFKEYSKQFVTRQDVVKTVLPRNGSRAFNAVLAAAGRQLRNDFGMELVEVRGKTDNGKGKGKGKRPADIGPVNGEGSENEDNAGNVSKRAKGPVGSRKYALRSILPLALIEAMADPRPLLVPLDDDEEEVDGPVDPGTLLRWDKGDGTPSGSLGLLGVRTIILCLIMTLGRVIADDHLHSLVKRLNIYRDTVLPYAPRDNKEPPMTFDKYLDLLQRQNYLEKTEIRGVGNNADDVNIEWRWGSRADVEFSEKAAAAFIGKVFHSTERSDGEDEEEEGERPGPSRTRANGHARGQDPPQRNRREEREHRRNKLQTDIVKAVGGPLAGEV